MRQLTIVFVSFIVASQSVLSAYAAPIPTGISDESIVIEQNTVETSAPKKTPQSQPQTTSSSPEKSTEVLPARWDEL